MIKIPLPAPPANYERDVRRRGQAFLRRCPNPNNHQWRNHDYWCKVHDYLYQEHDGICLYCASWTPRKSPAAQQDFHTSIDHFEPKSYNANLAYEWSNFRLCRARLNNYKDNFRDVLDPCFVLDDWFYLDFTTFLIKPAPSVADPNLQLQIKNTIGRLRLNIDNDYVSERVSVISNYAFDRLSFIKIKKKYPFIAQQIEIQNFDQDYKQRIKLLFTKIGAN